MADDLTAYAGRYADPGEVLTFTRSGEGLTVTGELLIQPGSWQPAIQPSPAPAAPVTFLARTWRWRTALACRSFAMRPAGCSGFRPACASCRVWPATDQRGGPRLPLRTASTTLRMESTTSCGCSLWISWLLFVLVMCSASGAR